MNIFVYRSKENKLVAYEIPASTANVLEALVYIKENIDSTLSFNYGCRYKKCGLCAMTINGKPALACLTPAEEGCIIKPLAGFKVVRDLVVDRSIINSGLKKLYSSMDEDFEAGLHSQIKEPAARKKLLKCNECLCCLSACSVYNSDENLFRGPLFWVKMAQLYLHPLNDCDMNIKIKLSEIDKCTECRQCACPQGINIVEDVVKLFQ